MSIFVVTGRHLSWLACLLMAPGGPSVPVCHADDLASSVNSELLDLARAFRSLDQSYQYRGMSSRLALTAGSVFVDWEAKGVPPEHRHPVSAPAPVLVGCAKTAGCAKVEEGCSDCGPRNELGGDHGHGHHLVPQSACSDCSGVTSFGTTPLHGSGSNCAATIGIPLHPRCHDCTATIGIPLHPHAFADQIGGCNADHSCNSCRESHSRDCGSNGCNDCHAAGKCGDFFVVEQYRDGHLTRTLVPCDRCRNGEHPQ